MFERSNMCMGIMDSQISIYMTGIVVYKYRISSIKRPGVYFFRGEIYPAFKRGRRLYGAGVYFSLLAPAPYKLH